MSTIQNQAVGSFGGTRGIWGTILGLVALLYGDSIALADDPFGARQLLQRHVLEALSRATKTTVAITHHPDSLPAVRSRRMIIEQLDQLARSEQSMSSPEVRLPSLPVPNYSPRRNEHHLVANAATLPIPWGEQPGVPRANLGAKLADTVQPQLLPQSTDIVAQPIQALATDEQQIRTGSSLPTELVPRRFHELPALQPMRGEAQPVSANIELLPPRDPTPARLTPTAEATPLVAVTPLNSNALVPMSPVDSTSPSSSAWGAAPRGNPLRTQAGAIMSTVPQAVVNPLR